MVKLRQITTISHRCPGHVTSHEDFLFVISELVSASACSCSWRRNVRQALHMLALAHILTGGCGSLAIPHGNVYVYVTYFVQRIATLSRNLHRHHPHRSSAFSHDLEHLASRHPPPGCAPGHLRSRQCHSWSVSLPAHPPRNCPSGELCHPAHPLTARTACGSLCARPVRLPPAGSRPHSPAPHTRSI